MDYEVVGARRRGAHRHLLRARHPRAGGGLRRPAPRQGLRREGARRTRRPRSATSARSCRWPRATAAWSSRAGWSMRSSPPAAVTVETSAQGDGAAARRARRARARSAAAPLQVRRLPLGAEAAAAATSSRASTAPSIARRTTAHDMMEFDHRPLTSRSSGAQRRRARGRARPAAGGALQPASSSRRPPPAARASGVPAKGLTGHGLRGPLLLGHRDLRRPVPDVHTSPQVARSAAALPLRDARPPRARAPRETGAARRAVPVAHDQRRGGLGVLRGRHRAVPHQRRHRLRPAPVRLRDGRPGVPARRRRAGARRDRSPVDGARLLLRPRRRALRHQRRDRARRVHDRRRQQRLHEPDGQGEPRGRRPRHRVAGGPGAGGLR